MGGLYRGTVTYSPCRSKEQAINGVIHTVRTVQRHGATCFTSYVVAPEGREELHVNLTPALAAVKQVKEVKER